MRLSNGLMSKFPFRKDVRGQGQIEFIVAITTVLVVVFMTIELCSAVYTYVVLSDAVNEGLRYAIVHSSDGSNTNTVNVVTNYAVHSLHDVSGLETAVTIGGDGTWKPPNPVTVSLTYPYVPYISWLGVNPTMHAYAQGRFVY